MRRASRSRPSPQIDGDVLLEYFPSFDRSMAAQRPDGVTRQRRVLPDEKVGTARGDACQEPGRAEVPIGDPHVVAVHQFDNLRRRSRPLFLKLVCWARGLRNQFDPKSGMAKAIGYLRNNFRALGCFLRHASIPVDNNRAEFALRRVALELPVDDAVVLEARKAGGAWETTR